MADNSINQGKKSIQLDKGIVSGGNLESLQKIFALNEADFLRLKMKDSKWKTLSGFIFAGVIGYIFSIANKIIDILSNKNVKAVNDQEWRIIVAGLFVSLILYVIGNYFQSERAKVMNSIEKYFSDSNV